MFRKIVPGLLSLVIITACTDQNYDQPVPVNEVPDKVIQAAQQALPGITITEAELENPEVYDLEGTLDGIEYEIDVSINGVVLDIEKESVEELEEVETEF